MKLRDTRSCLKLGIGAALLAVSSVALARSCPDDGDYMSVFIGTGTGEVDCWVGDTWETGFTHGRAQVFWSGSQRRIRAYRFGNAVGNAIATGWDSIDGSVICSAYDDTENGAFGTSIGCPSSLRYLTIHNN